MKKNFQFFIIYFFIFMSMNFLSSEVFAKQKEYEFEVLSTTDMHGRATINDITTLKEDNYSIEKAASIIKKERKKFGKRLILIDNGDLLQGTLVSEYAITKKKNIENPMITALKYLKYDIWVMGNHEFNYSPEQRNSQVRRALRANIAVLGGNIILKSSGKNINNEFVSAGEPYYAPYTIKKINFGNNKTVRVAIIGLGNANNAKWDKECNFPNLQFNSLNNPEGFLENEINKWSTKIKEKNLADIIIVSAHSGKSNDTGIQTNKFTLESQAIKGTRQSKNIDLLIYGHDHCANIEKLINADGKEIYIVNAGGTSVTKNVFNIFFDKTGKITNYTVTASAENLKDAKTDKKLGKKLEHWYKETYNYVSKPIGCFAGGWDNYRNEISNKTNTDLVLSQTKINDFIHKAQIWASWKDYNKTGIKGAEVSITSSILLLNAEGNIAFIPQDGKNISKTEISQIYRFANNSLCTIDMSPLQLYSWMSAVADKLTIEENGKIIIKKDESLHGVDTFYGIDYIFDISKPEGKRVVSAKINGINLLDRKKPVRVVLNSFRMSGCHGFYETTRLKESDCVWESSKFYDDEEDASIQSLIGLYVKQKGKITPNDSISQVKPSVWQIIGK